MHKKHISVLMFPEASYSFDGTATPLPRKMGVLLKKLNVPVVTVITHGAFLRDPLYNMLQKRKVQVRLAGCSLPVPIGKKIFLFVPGVADTGTGHMGVEH